jgi:hypothetical protein
MGKSAFIFLIFALAVMVSCSSKDSTTAIISVMRGDPPQASSDENSVAIEEALLTSHLFGQLVNEKLGLSKLWGQSEEESITRLNKAITVKAGNNPGTFVISCDGLEHGIAVKIVNELCDLATKNQTGEVSNNIQQKVQVSIIQPAK